MKNISCSKCDPWGAHLFGAEGSNKTVPVDAAVLAIPALCGPYCEQFYAACADVSMSFQFGQSPWGGAKIRDTYQSADAFCSSFTNSATDPTCFRYFLCVFVISRLCSLSAAVACTLLQMK